MTELRIAILGSRLNVVQGAAAVGVSPVLLHNPGAPEPLAYELCEQVLSVDLADAQAVQRTVIELHRERPFDRIISLTEECLLLAARLNECLGLGGNSLETVTLLKDKGRMRVRLAQCGLSPVRFRVCRERDELTSFLAELDGLPVIAKPVNGAGSVCVSRIATVADADRAWSAAGSAGRSACLLAEELLTGREISVEGCSEGGRHTFYTITDKVLTDTLVEVGHIMPACVPATTRREAEELVAAFLDAVGLIEGPTHTEVMLTGQGPRIVESHNRIGGGSIRDLVMMACGVDLARLAVSVPLGLESVPAAPGSPSGAAIRFFQAEPGRVVSVTGVERAGQVPRTAITGLPLEGAVVPPMRTSFDRVNGYVIGGGRDGAEAAARCARVLELVQINTVPEPPALPGQDTADGTASGSQLS